MECPLCSSTHLNEFETVAGIIYLRCANCKSVLKHPSNYPSIEAEKERYLLHNNNVKNKGYQSFVQPIVQAILNTKPKIEVGLDFGAGTGPVIAQILKDKGYDIALYDPFFHIDKEVLNKSYDFIICCEVIEHFHSPATEFALLKKLLKPGGSIFCMTHLLPDKKDFKHWYYKNDPTHVIFYSKENIKWIKSHFLFSKVHINGRLIILDNF